MEYICVYREHVGEHNAHKSILELIDMQCARGTDRTESGSLTRSIVETVSIIVVRARRKIPGDALGTDAVFFSDNAEGERVKFRKAGNRAG